MQVGLTNLTSTVFERLPQRTENELQAKFGALLRPEVLRCGRKLFTGYLTTNGVACSLHYKCWVVRLKPEKLGMYVKHTHTHTHTHTHIHTHVKFLSFTDLYSFT